MLKSRQRRAVDHGLDHLIPLIDVKRVLAVRWPTLVDLIQAGRLTVYDVTGRNVDRRQVTETTWALRVLESDLQTYIDSIKVR